MFLLQTIFPKVYFDSRLKVFCKSRKEMFLIYFFEKILQ